MKGIIVQSFLKGIIMDNVSVRKVIMMIFKTVFAKNARIFGIILLNLKFCKVRFAPIIKMIIKLLVQNAIKITQF